MVAALVVAIGFGFMLGVSDAPNATASLIASRVTSYPKAMMLSFIAHTLGGLFAGEAVALTMASLVHVPPNRTAVTYLIGGLVSIGFTLLLTHRGIPVSASIALVGGLAGAAIVEAGWHGVGWGGFHGMRPYGVIGTLVAIVVSPLLGALCSAAVRYLLGRRLAKSTRSVLSPLKSAIWVSAFLVGLADGSNDGQKAMGMATVVLLAGGAIRTFAVPIWVVVVTALALGIGTAVGGRRIVRTVSSRFYRGGSLDCLAAQGSSALVILGSAWLGAPVSTSTVVASSMVGVGSVGRRRHVHWPTVVLVVWTWLITVPACAVLGAVLAGLAHIISSLF